MGGLARTKEAQELQIRRAVRRARAEVEGERLTRFLTTERQFCEEERERAMGSCDPSRVPPGLRGLIPLARRFGVGGQRRVPRSVHPPHHGARARGCPAGRCFMALGL